MALVKVIHKVAAYIGGRSYRPGDEAEIDENDFAESVHERLDPPLAPVVVEDEDEGYGYSDSGPVVKK